MSSGGLGRLIREKRATTEALHLPELDVTVRVRRPDVTGLIMESGRIPNFMLGQLEGVLGGGGAPTTDEGRSTQLLEIAGVINLVVRACLVDPRVVDEEAGVELADDEVRLSDIPFSDRLVIFQWASMGGGADAARKFLEERAAELAALQPGAGMGDDAGAAAGST